MLLFADITTLAYLTGFDALPMWVIREVTGMPSVNVCSPPVFPCKRCSFRALFFLFSFGPRAMFSLFLSLLYSPSEWWQDAAWEACQYLCALSTCFCIWLKWDVINMLAALKFVGGAELLRTPGLCSQHLESFLVNIIVWMLLFL